MTIVKPAVDHSVGVVQTEYVECACYSSSHVFRFVVDHDNCVPQAWGEFVFADVLGFWGRLGRGLRYAFNASRGPGSGRPWFEEFVIDQKGAEAIAALMTDYADACKLGPPYPKI